MPKPNFFIVGTPKAGTTSLYNYLDQHPQVFLPFIKEPHFFSCPEVKNSYYKAKFIDELKAYNSLFDDANINSLAIGDLSTSYLYNENAASKIKEYNPEAKIVIVLRNPTERALSHYLMDRNLGYVNVEFSSLLDNPTRNKAFYDQYIKRGFYPEQIRRFRDCFPESNIRIILSDDLFSATEETVKNLFEFLGVSSDIEFDANKNFNEYKEARFPLINNLLQSPWINVIRKSVPDSTIDSLKQFLFKKDSNKPLFETEKERLDQLFAQSITETEQLISRDLSGWINKSLERS